MSNLINNVNIVEISENKKDRRKTFVVCGVSTGFEEILQRENVKRKQGKNLNII